MRIQPTGATLFLSAALPSLTAALGFDCAHINIDRYKYDLSALGGVHEVSHVNETEEFVTNTTYVLNICKILKGAANRGDAKCGTSKNICGFVHESPKNGNGGASFGFPIVGFEHVGGGTKDPKVTRLSTLDEDLEGLRVEMGGGEYRGEHNDEKPKDASAMIDFKCDPDRSGLEGLGEDEENEDEDEDKRRRDDDDDDDDEEESARGRSLQFVSFNHTEDDTYVLKLDWQTRYACDEYQRGKIKNSSHWGFFTWFIVILFLCVAAYLIFGSWLNYNRYGARGWDLLPHGDTIRDAPYIFQDWVRRVVNTLQGGGARGGYSAV